MVGDIDRGQHNHLETWVLVRRPLALDRPALWDSILFTTREEAESHYDDLLLFLGAHEMRLLAPSGCIVRSHRDPTFRKGRTAATPTQRLASAG